MLPGVVSPVSLTHGLTDAFAPSIIAGDATPEEAAEEYRRAKKFRDDAMWMGVLFGGAAALLMAARKKT